MPVLARYLVTLPILTALVGCSYDIDAFRKKARLTDSGTEPGSGGRVGSSEDSGLSDTGGQSGAGGDGSDSNIRIDAGGNRTDAGPAGDDGGPAGNESGYLCDNPGEIQCDGPASDTRSICLGGFWQTTDPCTDGQLCDRRSGECEDVISECLGKEPGEAFCDGAARIFCGPDLVSVDSTKCSTIQHCDQATGEACAICLEDEYKCDGDDLQICNDDHDGFDRVTTCEKEPCNATLGKCTSQFCNRGEYTCDNSSNTLQRCNDDGTAFASETSCDDNICDAEGGQCDECIPDETIGCADSTSKQICDSDGQGSSDLLCVAEDPDRPLCVGIGQCVECTNSQEHCSAQNDCYNATCNNWECGETFRGQDAVCSSGYCDSGGTCRECTRASQCSAANDCYTATCDSNSCKDVKKDTGTPCDFDGGSYCTEDGECKECTQNNHCTATNDCYSASCNNSNACVNTPRSRGFGCDFGGGNFCDGDGDCVECTQASHCTATNGCYTADCENNDTCSDTPKSEGSSCSFDGGTVCDANGHCVECVSEDQCDTDQLCRSHSCVGAIHTVGNATAFSDSANVSADGLYMFRLPALSYDAVLLDFGFIGNAAGAQAKLVLYADNGIGTAPTGVPLAVTNPIALLNGEDSTPAQPPDVVLNGGAIYWIGIKTNASTTIRKQNNASSVGTRIYNPYGDPFPTGSAGTETNGVDWNLYIRVRDTE